MTLTSSNSMQDLLTQHVQEGKLYKRNSNNWVQCFACGHRCKIPPGREGICKVRFNVDGVLSVPWGYVGGLAVDPIEKKPFFHVVPGSLALSFGMLGCDYHCAYCQNWITSQALRDPRAIAPVQPITADEIVQIALDRQIPVLTSTYNEPLITSEWAVEVFRLARPNGIKCSYVSNGNGTNEVLEFIHPFIDMYKIDLKSFRQKNYQQLGGTIKAVVETIVSLHNMGVWLEIVTLVVPGFNDSDTELREIAEFLVSVSSDIPWHVTAFHQDYKMTDINSTSARSVMHAAEIGKEVGLKFVYAGNLPGNVGVWENTYCPSCGSRLIERNGFTVLRNSLVDGACPKCGLRIPGIWT